MEKSGRAGLHGEKDTTLSESCHHTFADLNAEGLNAKAVNDLLTMYEGTASPHVLRMSFVPEQEASNFDRQVTTFWSHLIQRDITSPLFFPPLKITWCGLCSSAPCCCPMARLAVDHSHINGNNPVNGDTFFNAAQLQTTLLPQMNKPSFQLKPLGATLRLKTTQKKQVSTIQRNIHKQIYGSLTDTLVERSVLLSQSTSHIGAHLVQPSSEAYGAGDRCFRVSVARRLMLPHPAAPNATDVVQSCPNKSAAGLICNKPVDTQQHHCHGCRCGGGVDRMHAANCAMSRRRHKLTQ